MRRYLVRSRSSKFPLNPALGPHTYHHKKHGTRIAIFLRRGETAMSLVRLLGFRTLSCGCVIGRYRELATSREVSYVEEKGTGCELHGHRRNHTIPEHLSTAVQLVAAARAS